jgi:hypothetical protein
MKNPLLLLAPVLFSSFLLLSGCASFFGSTSDNSREASTATSVETQDPQQETVEVAYTQYNDEARGISFDYPSDWTLKVKSDTDDKILVNFKSPAFDPDATDASKVMNFANLNFFMVDTGASATPNSFRDYAEDLLADNNYTLVEKGKSNLGNEEGVYLRMELHDPSSQYYDTEGKYVVSARDTRGYYLALTYTDDIGEAKIEEYLSILKHMTDSFVWEES